MIVSGCMLSVAGDGGPAELKALKSVSLALKRNWPNVNEFITAMHWDGIRAYVSWVDLPVEWQMRAVDSMFKANFVTTFMSNAPVQHRIVGHKVIVRKA